jgi:DNA repair exonuclease SbcCD nuclease subunit
MTIFSKNHNTFKKLDIIFLAGDVFDKMLSSSSKEFIMAIEWLSIVAMYCVKHNIKLRILEGTPSHDWHQSSAFSASLDNLGISIDYKYVDTLSVESMDDLGISILYVPDEWNHNADDTLTEVKSLYNKLDIKQTDIAIMHGQFKFQLPMIDLPSSHVEDEYLSLVKYYINIGHIHTSSVYGRILAQGSVDRLAHNEEEAKGCMVMNIYHTGDMDFVFIKNPNAYPFRKFDLSKLDTKEIVAFLNKQLPKLALGTRVKIVVSGSDVNKLLLPVRDKFKDLIFKIEKKKVVSDKVIVKNRVEFVPFAITQDNITDLLIEDISKQCLTKSEVNIINEELSHVV